MSVARWRVVVTAGLLAVVGASGSPGAQPVPSAQPAGPRPPAEIAVPEGNGVPVITDGLFSPGEWDDAHRLALTASVQLCLKQYRGDAGGARPSLDTGLAGGQLLGLVSSR